LDAGKWTPTPKTERTTLPFKKAPPASVPENRHPYEDPRGESADTPRASRAVGRQQASATAIAEPAPRPVVNSTRARLNHRFIASCVLFISAGLCFFDVWHPGEGVPMKPTLKMMAASLICFGLTGCTTAELEAISAGLAQGLAEASYETSAYNNYGAYSGPYYAPSTFSSYSGWPSAYSYGQYMGAYGCRHTGTFYTCDSDGNGYADMYGNRSDGSYASSSLRVNGMGEAFTWDTECDCWARNRAYDGERKARYSNYRDYDYD